MLRHEVNVAYLLAALACTGVLALATPPAAAAGACPFFPGAPATDTDADGIPDGCDNCLLRANPAQCDSDKDGFGNQCDADLNNNGVVNAQDTTLYRLQLGKPSLAPDFNKADLNCNGVVNAQDTALGRALAGFAPGPTALAARLANRPPVARAGPDQTVAVGATALLDGGGSTDVDGHPLQYLWRVISTPPGGSGVLDNPRSARPHLGVDVAGTFVVELLVFDGTAVSAPSTVRISTGNSAPVAHAGPDQTVGVASLVVLDGSRSTDVNGDPLAFNWVISGTPAGSQAQLVNPAAVDARFVADLPGTYTIDLFVSDGQDTSPADTVVVTTAPGNSRPVANAGPDQASAAGALVALDGSASADANDDPLTYRWSLIARPAGSAATLTSGQVAQPSFTTDVQGTYVAQLLVNDGQADSAPDTVVVTTTPGNSAPIARADVLVYPTSPECAGNIVEPEPGTGTVAAGNTTSVTGCRSSDPDGDPLTYEWALTTRPVGSGAAVYPPDAERPELYTDLRGKYIAQLIVKDGSGAASTPDTVVVDATNHRPPVAIAGPLQEVLDVDVPIQLVGDGSYDPDGCPLEYDWALTADPSELSPCSASNGGNGLCPATLSPAGGDVANPQVSRFNPIVLPTEGDYQFTLAVREAAAPGTDCGDGRTSTAATTVRMLRAPRISTGDAAIFEGDSGTSELEFTVNVTGAVVRPASVAWAVVPGSAQTPSDFQASPSSGVFTFPVGFIGERTITVQVNGDTDFEQGNDETFTVEFSSPVNAFVTRNGTGTIFNDDRGDPTDLNCVISIGPSLALKTYQGGNLPVVLGVPMGLPAGVEIDLVSSSPDVASVAASVVVPPLPPGLTSAPPATVQAGSIAGTAIITATATGCTAGTANVAVANRQMSAAVQSAVLGIGDTTTGTVTLAEPAPQDLTVGLGSSNAAVATVPGTLEFLAGQSSRTFLVDGVAGGTADITVAAPGYDSAQVSVSVNGP